MSRMMFVAMLVLAGVASAGQPESPNVETIQRAKDLIGDAWFLGSKKSLALSDYVEWELPADVLTPGEAAEYLFKQAEDCGFPSYTGIYYNLGQYYLSRDCEKATGYFLKHNRLFDDEPDSALILSAIERGGCETAIEQLAEKQE